MSTYGNRLSINRPSIFPNGDIIHGKWFEKVAEWWLSDSTLFSMGMQYIWRKYEVFTYVDSKFRSRTEVSGTWK